MENNQIFNSRILKDYLAEITSSHLRDLYVKLDKDFVSPTFTITPDQLHGLRLHHVRRTSSVFNECGEWSKPSRSVTHHRAFKDIYDPNKAIPTSEVQSGNDRVLFYTGLENLVTILSFRFWPKLFSTVIEDLTTLIGDMVVDTEKHHNAAKLTLKVNEPFQSLEGSKKKPKTYFCHVFKLSQKGSVFHSDDFKLFEKAIAIYPEVLRFSDRQDFNYRYPQVPGLVEVLDKLVAWNPEQEAGTRLEFGVTFIKQVDLPDQPDIPNLRFHLFGLRVTDVHNDEVAEQSELLKEVLKTLPQHAKNRLFDKNEALLGSVSSESAAAMFAHLMRKSFFTENNAYVDVNEQLEMFKEYFLARDGAQATIMVSRERGESSLSLRLEIRGKYLRNTRQPHCWEFVQSWKLARNGHW